MTWCFSRALYDSLDDVLAKAPQDLAAHVARSKQVRASGSLLMAGAFVKEAEPSIRAAIQPTGEAGSVRA